MGEGRVQSQVVALCAEAADLADAPRRGDRAVAKLFAGVDVRQVDLDRGHAAGVDRVANRDAGVGVAARVDHDRVEAARAAGLRTISPSRLVCTAGARAPRAGALGELGVDSRRTWSCRRPRDPGCRAGSGSGRGGPGRGPAAWLRALALRRSARSGSAGSRARAHEVAALPKLAPGPMHDRDEVLGESMRTRRVSSSALDRELLEPADLEDVAWPSGPGRG